MDEAGKILLLSSQTGNSADCLVNSSDSSDLLTSLSSKISKKLKQKLEEVIAEITSLEKLE
jgi:hypothetical protein